MVSSVCSLGLSIINLAQIPHPSKVSFAVQRKIQSLHFQGSSLIYSFNLASATYIDLEDRREEEVTVLWRLLLPDTWVNVRSAAVFWWILENHCLLLQIEIACGSFMETLVDWMEFLASSYELLALGNSGWNLQLWLQWTLFSKLFQKLGKTIILI